MDAVPCEIENGIFCFYKMKRERPPYSLFIIMLIQLIMDLLLL